MFFLSAAALATSVPADDPKHANHFERPAAQTEAATSLEVRGVWARAATAKATVIVQNRSSDILRFRPSKSAFETAGSSTPAQVFVPHEAKPVLFLEPGASIDGQLIFKGKGLHHDAATLTVAGLDLISGKSATALEMPDLQLPLTTRNVSAKNVRCTPGKVKQQTDETKVKLECSYEGDSLLFVDQGAVQVRLAEGQTFANDAKADPMVIEPGEEFTLTAAFHVSAKIVDMQFATLQVTFDSTFKEGSAVPVTYAPIALTLDPKLTEAKNR